MIKLQCEGQIEILAKNFNYVIAAFFCKWYDV